MFRSTNPYAQTLRLAIPVVLSQAGQIVVQLVDNAMVGRLGALPLAAVSFGGTVFFLIFIFGVGISMGITPLVGEMYARSNHRISASYLQNSILLYGTLGLLLFGVSQAVIPLMPHMGQQPEVVEMAIPYYRYLAWSIIPFMLFAAFKQFLEGVGNTKVAMVIIIVSNLINILFNYLFIYGKLGCPAMGAAGAGLATLISRILTPLLIILYFQRRDSFRRYFSLFRKAEFSAHRLRSLLGVGLPIALQMVMEGGAFVLTAIMMGWIGNGTIPLAGNQIATVISNLAFMIIVGISAATTIRISHEFGRGDLRALRTAANISYRLGLMWNGLTATIFILFRHQIPLLFTSDPEVVEMASRLLIFAGLFQFSDGLQNISVGILRGIQDVNAIMGIAFVAYLLINLPVGYLCAFTLGWGPEGLWIGFIFGLSIAAFLLNRRYRRSLKKLATIAHPE